MCKNDVFVAKICKYALYECSEGLFCAPRKPANPCHPGLEYCIVKNIDRSTTDPEIDSVTWTKFGNNMAPLAFNAFDSCKLGHQMAHLH